MKICVDTTLQESVEDDYRGRVFSVYDTLFNVTFVAALLVGAFVLPASGISYPLLRRRSGSGYLLTAAPTPASPAATEFPHRRAHRARRVSSPGRRARPAPPSGRWWPASTRGPGRTPTGPLPRDQSVSVACRVSPATRRLPPMSTLEPA